MTEPETTDYAFSPEQGDFAVAMSKVQGEIVNPKKTSENPYFKSTYADLAAVIDACRPLLAKYQIAVLQLTIVRGDRAGCITRLIHSSGQWVQCTTLLKPSKDDPQAMGSCFTYARRYALQGFLGIAGEDDDGNAASQPKPEQRQRPKEQPDANVPYEMCLGAKLRADAMDKSFKLAWPKSTTLRQWVTEHAIMGFTSWDAVEKCTDRQKLDNLYLAISAETKERVAKAAAVRQMKESVEYESKNQVAAGA